MYMYEVHFKIYKNYMKTAIQVEPSLKIFQNV